MPPASNEKPRTVSEIRDLVGPLPPAAERLIVGVVEPAAAVAKLVEGNRLSEAVAFLAGSLDCRSSVWWACLIAQHSERFQPSASNAVAITRALHWVIDPSEENRRLAHEASLLASPKTVGGCAALIAHYAGLERTPANDDQRRSLRRSVAMVAAGTAHLTAAIAKDEFDGDPERQYLAIGIDIANGINRWEAS